MSGSTIRAAASGAGANSDAPSSRSELIALLQSSLAPLVEPVSARQAIVTTPPVVGSAIATTLMCVCASGIS